jgi:serine protease Do
MRTSPLALAALFLAVPAIAPRPAAADDLDVRRNPIVRAVETARLGVVSIRTNEIVQVPRYYEWFFDDGRTVPQEREGALGTGAIFHPAGYVITNAHVISRASKIFVQLLRPGGVEQEREARLVAVDLENDLAILRLVGADGGAETYPFLPLGRSDDLMLGESVIAIGNPFRLGITVTTGIVSALRRSIRPQHSQDTEFRDFIQTDAAINPGNSGGPLLDVTGRWIGVNTAILNRATGAEGIGFAIPADRVRDMIGRTFKRRLASGEWTGFDVDANKSGSPVVREVYATGPASGTGLEAGDRILAVDGRATPSLFEYRLAEVDAPAGGVLRLRVRRGDGERDVEVPLTARTADALSIAKARLGFAARDAVPSDVRSLGVGPGGGVVISEVARDGPAARVLLRPNDVLTALGTFKVRSVEDLLFVLEMIQSKDTLKLQVRRLVQNRFGEVGIQTLNGTIVAD